MRRTFIVDADAARQGKEAVLIVEFPDLVVEAKIRRKVR